MPLSMQQVGMFRCFEGTFIFDTSSSGPSDYIIIPPDVDRISVQLEVLSSCVATVEATCSLFSEVESNTATWKAWDNGNITGGVVSQDATKGPISSLRLRVITPLAGTQAKINVRAQRGNP